MRMKNAWKQGAVETREALGGKIKGRIVYDDCPLNPRKEYDNQTVFICSHRRYNLGDVSYHDKSRNEIHESIWLESSTDAECAELVDLILGCMNEDKASAMRADFNEAPARDVFEYLIGHGWSCDRVRESVPECFVSLPLFLIDHSGLSISVGSFGCTWDSGQVGIALARVADFPSAEDALRAIRGEVETYDRYLRGECYAWELWDTRDDAEEYCGSYDSVESAMAELEAAMARQEATESPGIAESNYGLFNN